MGGENYIIDRIEELCKQKKLSRYRLSQKAGISQSSLSTLMNRKSVPTIPTLERICEGMGITLAQFFARDQILDLTDEQKDILGLWSSLDEQEKELVKAYIQGLHRVTGSQQ